MKQALFKTPILFIIYNRPDLASKVFEEIKKIRPERLYVAADGPKTNNSEAIALCQQTRSVVNQVDWECTVVTKFQEQNLGCKHNVSGAINWFFDHEEEGIILEDDCKPSESFFHYCSLLLEKYRYDNTVGHIGGTNFSTHTFQTKSYFFSKYSFVWGWATWRRAWKLYDVSISTFPDVLINDQFKNYFNSTSEKYTFYNKFLQVYSNQKDTWDYQWLYTLWYNHLKSIVPPANLVKNIGFDNRSTHPTRNDWVANYPLETMTEFSDADSNEIKREIDNFFYKKLYKRRLVSNILLVFKLFFYSFTLRQNLNKQPSLERELPLKIG